ncbi:MAG: hypothetical protein ACKVQB_00720 [Bacteroidia bacterium]
MKNNYLKIILSILALVLFINLAPQQDAPLRTTPFTAVKWDGDVPYVMVGGEWYMLVTAEKVKTEDIVAYCKANKGERWKKAFSEDFAEVMQQLGHTLPLTVELVLKKDKKTSIKKETMTTDNRKKVKEYNKANPEPEISEEQKKVVKDVQKDISGVNLKMEKPFEFKSAKIEFVITGHKLFAGTETMYIDDYGKTIVIELDKPGIAKMPEKSTIIWKDNKSTVINHIKKTYYTSAIRPKSTEPPTIAYSTAEQKKQGGYEKQTSETIAGKQCEVYKHNKNNVTYWLWKGIDLKIINYALGEKTGYTREAKSVEENITIPSSLFEIPAGYKK